MHESSYKYMQTFLSDYLRSGHKVLDVGSRRVLGHKTYREIATALSGVEYTGLDIVSGINVDIVVEPYSWDILPDNNFDIVISGQAFEHIEFPWLTMEEIARVIKTNGVICIITPACDYKYHPYPIDTFRYMKDGYTALCKWVNMRCVKQLEIIDANNKTEDSVAIIRVGG